MKHPNGYGTVARLSGNRRRPYIVKKTGGYDTRGYPVPDIIGYTTTKEEGLIMLAQYNNDPWDIDKSKTTFEELYALWEKKKFPKLGASNQSSLKAAYNHCSALYKKKYKEIRTYHMQDAIDGCGKGYSTQGAIKNLFGHLDAFAFETDVINKMYSELTTSEPIPETEKKPFTDKEIERIWKMYNKLNKSGIIPETKAKSFTDNEIKKLWENGGDEWIDSVLMFMYTGFRISELLDICTADVDLTQGVIKGGKKTKAGKGRIVPIHTKILPLVEKRLTEGKEYLLTYNGKKVSLTQYYKFWNEIMENLKIEHKPHESRHTIRSRLDSKGGNKKCIDLIMGHKSKEVGERVYTHKTIKELKDTIELLDY